MKIAILNAQNLFLLDNPSEYQRKTSLKRFQYNKPLLKTVELSKAIKEIDPDILMIMEVGGEESLNNFNKNFLDNHFVVSLIPGNSDRGIELGFLIRRKMPFSYDHYTHKNRLIDFNYLFEKKENERRKNINLPIIHKSHKFSRDLAELRIYSKENKELPKMILLLVHLKSQLDIYGNDKNGRGRREAELKTLVNVYIKLEKKFNYKVPIIVGGDFNGNAQSSHTDDEFKYLYEKTDLKDILEFINLPPERRTTLIGPHSEYGLKNPQFDFIFISEKYKNKISLERSGIYYYKNPKTGVPLPYPQEERDMKDFPSDHYPLALQLKDL